MSKLTYDALMAHVKTTRALGQVAGILSWDQEVMMPASGSEARAEQMAAVEAVSHQRRCDPLIGDWLEELQESSLDQKQRANVRLVKRSYERTRRVPADLAEELARVSSRAQIRWAAAREANQFDDFAPSLKTLVKLKREEAHCIAADGKSAYDALLNDFEPGMAVRSLQPLLKSLRPRLRELQQAFNDSRPSQPVLSGTFDGETQLKLARKLAESVGFEWKSGRLDLSVHPFSSGTANDTRITTRVDPADPLGCLYSTLHELGHALYEQGLTADLGLSPVSNHVSMGVHESQSRLWENQVGRSLPFCQWLYPVFRDAFGSCGMRNAQDFYRAVNRLETGFIRTEADEVHYNLHILLRFELERELIGGDIGVDELEAEWNRRFERDFGCAVPDASSGVLQDVHWSVGLFGYFPTYSLGNIYAAQLDAAMREEVSDLDDRLANGDTGPVLAWMRSNVHVHGSLYEPEELMERATGTTLSAEPLLNYLENKFSDLIGR